MTLPPLRSRISREFADYLRLSSLMTVGGLLVELLFFYVVIAFFLGDAGWVVP